MIPGTINIRRTHRSNMCADETASRLIGTHTSFAMLSPSSQPLSGLVKQWVGDRLRRGPEALLQAAARRGPEAVLRAPAATTRDLPPQVPHGTEEQSTPMHPAARRCHGCVRRCYPIAYPTAHAPRATTSTGEGACDLTYLFYYHGYDTWVVRGHTPRPILWSSDITCISYACSPPGSRAVSSPAK